jgi:hypothetical protein
MKEDFSNILTFDVRVSGHGGMTMGKEDGKRRGGEGSVKIVAGATMMPSEANEHGRFAVADRSPLSVHLARLATCPAGAVWIGGSVGAA